MPIRDVGDAVREAKHKGWSRKQAIAIGLKYEGKSRDRNKKRARKRA